MKLADFSPLAGVPDATFISLQKGPPAEQLKYPPAGLQIADFAGELQDFSDTAALICALDLVITVDTSVAHLAGALGRPVWVLITFSPDWRWMLDRNDSPWYPTMRLFRQHQMNDWNQVTQDVAQSLQSLVRR